VSSHKSKKIFKKLQIVRFDASDLEEVNKFAKIELPIYDVPSIYIVFNGTHYPIDLEYPLQLDKVLQHIHRVAVPVIELSKE
jgi:hypothetical protein